MITFKFPLVKILTGVVALSTIAMQNTAQTKNQIRKIGSAYCVDTNNGTAILYVTEEKTPGGFEYSLSLNHAADNSEIKRQQLFSKQEAISAENIIGSLANNIWILGDSLVAYDMNTLQPVITETMIAEKNSFMQNNFTRYPNSYLLDEGAGIFYINSASGDGYKLYTNDLTLKKDDGKNEVAPDDYQYEFAAEYKVNDRYDIKYALSNIDTSENKLYILGSDKETRQVISYYGTAIYAEREELRHISILPFNKEENKIEQKNKPVTKQNAYRRGGFLNKKFSDRAWKGKNNERIIVYINRQGTAPKMAVAMVDKNGNETWKALTGKDFHYFNDYLINGQYLVLFFDAAASEKASFVSINLANGQVQQYCFQ